MKMYEVGGCVRDEILGVPTKDIDLTVVLDENDTTALAYEHLDFDPFKYMVFMLKERGFKIFLETPEYLTVRAKFPKGNKYGHLTADFVLARKESGYADGRRPDVVEPGTLEDDLARRDFSMNAIAKGGDGYIDPFGGVQDIRDKVIRAVGDPMERFTEDALRAVRAFRFAVTKGFLIHPDTLAAANSFEVTDAIRDKISDERIQQELSKAFRFDTIASLDVLGYYFNRHFREAMFSGKVSLDATMKQKGFGK